MQNTSGEIASILVAADEKKQLKLFDRDYLITVEPE